MVDWILGGRAVDRLSAGEKARLRNIEVGLIFQSFNLIADMTVYENVEYPLTAAEPAAPTSGRRARTRRWIGSASPRVRSSARGSCQADISSSWRSRVRLPGGPPILLADEPTGNLDSKSGDALMQMLGELHADGATVCLATHDPRYIALAKRHIYLFDGRISDTPVSIHRHAGVVIYPASAGLPPAASASWRQIP